MPRLSLPSTLKQLQSYEVLVTQTTEEELKSYFNTYFSVFQSESRKYTNRIDAVLSTFIDGNPYANHNWKKGKPSRYYNEPFAWFGTDDIEMVEYSKFCRFCHDVKILIKEYDWEELNEMEFECEKFITQIAIDQKNLLNFELVRFNQAKTKFEEENKEWVQEQKDISNHKLTHFGRNLVYKERNGSSIEEDLKCQYCKIEYDKEFEMLQNHLDRQKRMCGDITTKYKSESESESECEFNPICEDCGFKSTDKNEYNEHISNPKHIKMIELQALFCDACSIQCQTIAKFKEHIETSKHKKNTKVIEVKSYECEKCQYKTTLKHHYNQHINTQKHKNIVVIV